MPVDPRILVRPLQRLTSSSLWQSAAVIARCCLSVAGRTASNAAGCRHPRLNDRSRLNLPLGSAVRRRPLDGGMLRNPSLGVKDEDVRFTRVSGSWPASRGGGQRVSTFEVSQRELTALTGRTQTTPAACVQALSPTTPCAASGEPAPTRQAGLLPNRATPCDKDRT